MAIYRTQFGNIMKLKEKYFQPYEVSAAKNHDRYGVEKLGDREVFGKTATGADYVKLRPMG